MAAVKGYADDLEFLGAALEVIRLRGRLRILEREQAGLIPRDPVTMMSEGEVDHDAVTAELATRAGEHDKRLAKTKEPPALVKVQETFGLDAFERDVLLLALAPAIDGSFGSLFGRVRGSAYRAPLDIDAALTLLLDDFGDRVRYRQAFAPSGRLLQANLLHVGRGAPDGGDEFLGLELRLPARLVTLLLGQPGDDETLQAFSRLIEPTETLERVILPFEDKQRIVELIALHAAYVEALGVWGLREAIPYGRGITMLFAGPPGTGKTLTARAVAHHLGRRLLLVDTARLADQQRSFETNLDNLLREARLQSAVLFFDECEGLFAAQNRLGGHLSALLQAIEHFDGICIMATNLPQLLDHALDRRILYRVNFQTPTPTMREEIWKVHLPPKLPLADDVDVAYLSRRFEFTGGYIKNSVLLAAGAAAGRASTGRGTPAVCQRDLLEACYSQLRSRLHELADHDQADLRLDDLILPEDVKGQIVEIIEAVSAQSRVFREWGFGKKFNKGRGLSALFDGDPGTGKTLSAEVIAAELGLGLYRVNVANVVSKYIGETEKNLTRIFTEARGSQSVLLFDEADSLFSKRVEVKGSNDRFANMETNVLLQLIERYDGLVILTTNLKTSIDNAFERRLSFKINFPFPDPETRASIWAHLLPSEAPIEKELDFDLLGECFELSGGSIKNAVLRSAYRAAATSKPLSMDLFEDAAKRECQAAGKLFRVARREESW